MLKGKRNRLGHDRSVHGLSRKRVQKLTTEDDDDISALSSSSKHSFPVSSPLHHTIASTTEKNTIKEKNSHGLVINRNIIKFNKTIYKHIIKVITILLNILLQTLEAKFVRY